MKSEYTESHRDALRHGGPCLRELVPGFLNPDGSENVDAIREAWNELRSVIMDEWTTAGKRPAAWWWFESPEHRNPDMSEAEQLNRLHMLTKDELSQLAVEARVENRRLHLSNYNAGLPFRRSWPFWKFVAAEQRDTGTTEYEQLRKLDELTSYEKRIRANPALALAGRLGYRSRFYYLSEREQVLLDLPHKVLKTTA